MDINTNEKSQSGFGIAGMVIGIVSLLLACFLVGGFLGIVGLVLSIVGITQKGKKTGTAVAGIVLNILAIILMIIMFFAIVSRSDTTNNATIGHNIIATSESEQEIIVSEEPSIESSMIAESLPTVGQYVEGKVWKISLLTAKEYEQIEGEYYSDKPGDGNNFLVLFFEVENVSSEDDYFNYFYLESYLDGYATDIKFVMNNPEGYATLSGDVAAGKKMKGCIVYEVPKSGWSDLEVSYKDWVGTSNKIATFLVTPENISE